MGGVDGAAQLVETLRYKTEGLGFGSRWVVIVIIIILPAALWPWCRLSL
jgi:hypothetical protein